MDIRNATIEEMDATNFALWHTAGGDSEDFDTDISISVVDIDGEIVAFATHQGTYIYSVECNVCGKGYARALVEYILDGADYAIADNVQGGAAGFWTALGFEPIGRKTMNGQNYDWYPEED
jgi:uncharacterized protein GlcG (DUF336 family)